MDLYLKKHNNTLIPADRHNESVLEELKNGQWYKAKLNIPRNINFHRKFFALLNTVVELSDFYTCKPKGLAVEELKERVKFKTGWYEIFTYVEDTPLVRTKSIAFDKMDNKQFEDFYNRAIDVIIQDEELNIKDLRGVLEFAG